MKCIITEKMINSYIKLYFSTEIPENTPQVEQEFMKKQFKEKIFEKVKQEIYDLEVERILKEVEKKQKVEDQKRQMKKLNFFILETLLIGVIVGLLVNQITDFISYLKGSMIINTTLTFRWIMAIIVVLILFVLLVYGSHAREIFNSDKEE